jgi:AraC-like DNA-binding protein
MRTCMLWLWRGAAGRHWIDKVKRHLPEIAIRHYGTAEIRHSHGHHQLVLPLAGTMEREAAGRTGSVTGLRAAAIPGGEVHAFTGADENAFLIVDIPAGTARGRFWEAAGDRPFLDFGPDLAGHLAFLAAALRSTPLTGIRGAVAGEMILDGLARHAGLAAPPLPEPVARAVRLIETCAAAPLTVEDIARTAGMSPSRLHARFREATGVSPMRYLAAERARRAAFLLERTAHPVATIAQEAGYADQSAFTRAFRRETGLTPQEHRARARGQESRHEVR